MDVLGYLDVVTKRPSGFVQRLQEKERIIQGSALRVPTGSLPPLERPALFCQAKRYGDALLLYADDASYRSMICLTEAVWRLFELYTRLGFPVRGGVSVGDLVVPPDGMPPSGTAMDAANLEKKQEWVGVGFARRLWGHGPIVEALMGLERRRLIRPYRVPTGNDELADHALNWPNTSRLIDKTPEQLMNLFTNHLGGPDPKIERKLRTTRRFVQHCREPPSNGTVKASRSYGSPWTVSAPFSGHGRSPDAESPLLVA